LTNTRLPEIAGCAQVSLAETLYFFRGSNAVVLLRAEKGELVVRVGRKTGQLFSYLGDRHVPFVSDALCGRLIERDV